MPPLHEFFVDLDSETVKRVLVHRGDQGKFVIETCLQFDKGWETEPQKVEVKNEQALARRLIEEGLAAQVVYDGLGIEAPPGRSMSIVIAISFAIWMVIGLTVAWLAGWV
jgi:hypothetical protein